MGTSNRMSCCGLATLTTVNPPAWQSVPGAADALVGPFDGLDGQHGLVLDGHALADVQPAHLLGHPPAEFDVLLLGEVGPRSRQLAVASTSSSGA